MSVGMVSVAQLPTGRGMLTVTLKVQVVSELIDVEVGVTVIEDALKVTDVPTV